jgi:hypothetical protein
MVEQMTSPPNLKKKNTEPRIRPKLYQGSGSVVGVQNDNLANGQALYDKYAGGSLENTLNTKAPGATSGPLYLNKSENNYSQAQVQTTEVGLGEMMLRPDTNEIGI